MYQQKAYEENLKKMEQFTIISYVLHAMILNKLNTLRDSMKQVHKGNFQVHTPFYGTGEIAELAHYFRRMLSRL